MDVTGACMVAARSIFIIYVFICIYSTLWSEAKGFKDNIRLFSDFSDLCIKKYSREQRAPSARACLSLSLSFSLPFFLSNDSQRKRQRFLREKTSGDVSRRSFRFLHHGFAFAGTGDAVIDFAKVSHGNEFFFVRGVREFTGGGINRR